MQSLIHAPSYTPRVLTLTKSAKTEEGTVERAESPSTTEASSRGPLLPPRTIKGPRRSSRDPPPPPPRPSSLKILAGVSLYSGLIGSLAYVIASVQDINLWTMFDWSSQDVPVSLAYLIPLQVINAIIMVPEYSSWALPKLDKGSEEGVKPPPPPSVMELDPILDLSSLGASSTAPSSDTPPPSPSSPVSAASWGKPISPKKGPSTLKDALFIAQSHFAANNPTQGLNLGLEIISASVSSLSTELLYRGVSITLLASWINDRLYEAGCDDFISLPSCILFLFGHAEGSLTSLEIMPIGTYEAARWSAALALVGLSVALVLRKLIAQSPRKAIVIQVFGDESSSDGKAGSKPATPKARPLPLFQDTIKVANVIQGARNVSQTLCLNFIFAATGGNLAATYAASMVNQAIFSVMQHHSMQRTRKRSSELAAELKDFNAKLRDIQARMEENKKMAKAHEASVVLPASTATAAEGGYFREYFKDETLPPSLHEASGEACHSIQELKSQTGVKRTLAALDLLLPEDSVPKPKA